MCNKGVSIHIIRYNIFIPIEVIGMRTNIDIDNDLMQKAKILTGLKTKKAVVEAGLKKLIMLGEQAEIIKQLTGAVPDWEGDIRAMRKDRDSAQW